MTSILLVEDDPWLAELEASVLTDAGYEVTHAPHAPSAIAKIDENQPDVIILDVLLTGSTAFALLHELQSYGDTKDVPIILCTNMAENLKLEELKTYGVRRIIDKTIMHPDDLIAAINEVLL
ncbi:MAG: response regulator [Candidatus Microsaccharimonas sossegonensis]|uniref:Response regulator n=1 Tax=Candidatus Microsaccharimonas sossegonensis TaxID=2506948 RepID=A0A4Q0AHV2_9BACT|nr:MAG: response regulator [Candidatus Microsaccharimonas sossegonensis]